MSPPTDILDPELEGLLREAAADPRSQLLRVPRPARVEGLLERQAVLRPSATGLTKLERHLLLVHRAELSDLLLRACAVLMFQDPDARLRVHRCKGPTEDRELETWEGLAADACTFREEAGARASGGDALALVRAFAGCAPDTPNPSLTQVALAAHRLQPSSRAMAWVGLDQALHGQDTSAVRVLGDLLRACPKLDVAAASLGNLGMAYSNLGRLDEAYRAYRAAFQRDHGRTTVLVGWMHYAIQAGAVEEARTASRILDETVRDPRPTFLELLNSYVARKRSGDLNVSAASRGIAEKLASEVGAVSGKVIDVYV